jgi:hypothetical protein
MTLVSENKIDDDLTDAIGKCLLELDTHPQWTKEKLHFISKFKANDSNSEEILKYKIIFNL